MPQIREHGEIETVVRSHAGWVHACASRRVGNEAMAEDVTQAVFILLWQKRSRLGKEVTVTGWLYRAVRYCAARALRVKRIRERHEREAAMAGLRDRSCGEATWGEVSPELERAVDRLSERDRAAVLLRFYRHMSFAEVGCCLGISEDAAQKRVERAVGKLREKLAGKGVEVEAGSLGAMVLAHAVEGMEGGVAGLVEKVMAGIGGGGGNGTAGMIAQGAAKMMVLAKVKVAAVVVGAALVAAVGAAEIVTHSGERSSAVAVPSKVASNVVGLATTQAVAVESPITAWKRGDADRAVELLRKTDWSAPGAVPIGSTFEMSEAKFIQMPQAERDRLQAEVQADARVLSALLRGAMAKGDEMAGRQDSSAAQSYYKGVDRCARYFAEDGRSLKIHQLVAIAAAKAVKLKLPQAKE